jgi:hypothetical protein
VGGARRDTPGEAAIGRQRRKRSESQDDQADDKDFDDRHSDDRDDISPAQLVQGNFVRSYTNCYRVRALITISRARCLPSLGLS